MFWDAIAAQGVPQRSPAESIGALEEAIQIIRALWTSGGGVRLDGKHYSLNGAEPGPFRRTTSASGSEPTSHGC